VLVNPLTQEEQECRIVFLGGSGERGQRVGVEFLTPAPHFWGIDFDARALPHSGRTARRIEGSTAALTGTDLKNTTAIAILPNSIRNRLAF